MQHHAGRQTTPTPYERFFSALIEWREWASTIKRDAETLAKLARKKHKRAKLVEELIQDDRGRIWFPGQWLGKEHYQLMSRSAPLAKYQTMTERKLVGDGPETIEQLLGAKSIRRARNHPEEDWGWEMAERGEPSTLEIASANAEAATRAVSLVNELIPRRTDIEAWMSAMGHALDRTDSESIKLDWPTLLAKFAPTYRNKRLPDAGQPIAALHHAIDILGGQPHLRRHMF